MLPNSRPMCHSPSSRAFRIARSAAATLLLLVVVLSIVFLVFAVLPSDPVRNALGINASEDAVAALRHQLGYDRPLAERYLRFMLSAIRLDFGESVHSGRDVRSLVIEGLSVTARNGALALSFSAMLSLSLIAIAQMKGRSFESAVLLGCRVLTSMPGIVVAIVTGVLIYAVVGGFGTGGLRAAMGVVAAIAVYPTCSLTEIGLGQAREVERATFVAAARGFGMTDFGVFVRCVLPGIVTSWMGQLSNLAASLLVSSSVMEVVFSLNGLGAVLARSVVENDLPVIQGVAVVIVLGFLGFDAIFDRGLLPRVVLYRRRFAV